MRRYHLHALLSIILLSALLVSCTAPVAPGAMPTVEPTTPPASAPTGEAEPATAVAPTTNLTDGCLEAFDPNVDYFPAKISLTYTDGFSVAYHNSYKVVTVVTPWPGAEEAQEYVLVQCGAPTPAGFDASQVIEVPVQRIVTMSTTYLPFLDAYGVLDRLVGVDDITYVNNPTVLQMAEAGQVVQIGYGASVNVEQVLELAPDLVMTYGSGSPDYDAHPVLLNAGIKVALNAEWLATSPLDRAEWGKFLALFFNEEAAAEALFAATVARYEALKAQAAAVTDQPTVLTDSAYQGTWYVAGGRSYTAQLLADAGAAYVWADDESTASMPVPFELVFDRGATAQYWINVGMVSSLAELQAMDERYPEFTAFAEGNVWNNNKRQNANGGNDYYESAVAHPDNVLADLIAIFHPELLPDHEFIYFQQLP
ncbi:MAG: ABC transporter substrate-binding protein [Caldilineaceae bacterium]|nr:ABC transporter substrate-binding protein [Caldilineaceae bacterium]